MSEQQDNPQRKKTNWRRILFFTSVGLNIILIMAMIGFAMRVMDNWIASADMGRYGALVRALPSEDRRDLFTKMRNDKSAHQARRMRSKALSTEFLDALTAVPFNPDALVQLQQENYDIRSTAAARFDTYWLELVVDMSDAQRADYAARIKEKSDHRKNKKSQGDRKTQSK